jgi:hypothetical protein
MMAARYAAISAGARCQQEVVFRHSASSRRIAFTSGAAAVNLTNPATAQAATRTIALPWHSKLSSARNAKA